MLGIQAVELVSYRRKARKVRKISEFYVPNGF